MAEESLFGIPNPVRKLRKAIEKALDAVTEHGPEISKKEEPDARRRALLAGGVAAVVMGPQQAVASVAKTVLPAASTVAGTIMGGGATVIPLSIHDVTVMLVKNASATASSLAGIVASALGEDNLAQGPATTY